MRKSKRTTAKQGIAPKVATRPPTLLETLQYAISEKEKTENAIAVLEGAGRTTSRLLLTASLVVAIISVITIALVLDGELTPGFATGSGLLGIGVITAAGRVVYRKWRGRRLG
ncbi:hypothetical protein [Lentzea sp. CA-135723]|uniref:hypothetical protein n=1 Tax=Lentzea sp. CA-135723 TaxID=3239950 RepID=UPI003D8E8A94